MSDIEIEYNIDDTPMTDDEIMGYLKRIGIECDINTDLNSLALLQKAHLTHIPYENYYCLERRITSLNHKELYRKLIIEHRGGICFELNGLYAWLLKSIGFDVKSHLSRYIIPEGEIHKRTHRVMTVTICGERYLTDVGVNSECSRKPLLLAEGLIQNDGISEYRLEKDDFFGWVLWQKLKNNDWRRLYGFTEEPQLDIDYIMPCNFCDIHPLSGINKFEKVSIFTDHSNIRIWDGHYQEFSEGEIIIDEIIEAEKKKEILQSIFSIKV
jgi:N-hydroxyarylamine O-acetyltransferase